MSTIQLASPSLTIAAPKGAGTPARAHAAAAKERADGAPADFTLSLAAFLDQLTPAADTPAAAAGRHAPAAAGKDVPAPAADDEDDDTLPAVLAWLPPVPTPTVTTLPKPPVILVPPTGDPAPPSGETARPQPIDGPPVEPILALKGKAPLPPEVVGSPATTPNEAAPASAPVERQPVPRISVAVAAADPQQASATAPPQPAAQVFAAALARAATPTRDDPLRAEPTDPAQPLAAAPAITTVAAPADTRQGTLDMSQPHWPRHMIDHIEALRDSADANDTRIRLVPDALGTIDVSLKREGDAVRVHFAAEQHETRTLLADAAPKLAELAEQRGIRLTHAMTDSSVGTGPGGDPRRTPERAQPQTPSRPASADTSTDPTRDEDARVA